MRLKRFLVMTVVLMLLCATCAIGVFAEEPDSAATRAVSGQWTYTIMNGTAKITAYSGTATSVTIPGTIDGYRVTALGDSVFADKATLTSITFNNNLESIGSEAFRNCTSLSAITLPLNLTSVGYHAFYNCTNLSSITINSKNLSDFSYDSCFYNAGKYATNGITVTFGNEVTRIPRYLFKCDQNYYARIKSVKMGSAITYIADSAFVNCFDLTTVTWGNSLVTIGSDAFNNCTNLTSVTLPESLETLGYHAFYNCTGLTSVTINAKKLGDLSYDSCFYNAGKNASNGISVTFGNTVTRIPRYLFKCDQNYYARIKSVNMGTAITEIADSAFVNCLDLNNVTWGSNLVTIGSDAFNNCTSLRSVTLPESLETLGYHAFYNCTGISSIAINAKQLNDLSYDSCFYNAGKNASNGISVTFGNTVTRIPRYIFKSSESNYVRVRTVKMGSALTLIANSAFENCLDLSSVTWGSNLVTINDAAFKNCTSLSNVSLPATLEIISSEVFMNCSGLTTVTLPVNLSTLGYHAFYNDTALSSITINSKKLNDFSYDSCFYNAGKYATNGITVTFGNEVTRIPRYLFKCDQNYYARIKSVKMGSAITYIADSAFVNCFDLTTVTWGNSLVTIGSDAFNNCTNLTSVTLPESLETLGYHAFYNCTGLTSVTINAKKLVDLSYDSCFYNAGKNATSGIIVTFGDAVTRIPKNLFKCDQNYYARIKSVKMGSAITLIGECAFENCLDINNITWGKKVSTISSYAFKNCQNISTVSLPSSVADIGYQAFAACTSLTSVTIPGSVTSIGDYAFDGCSDDLVIYGVSGSYAEEYASDWDIPFVAVAAPKITTQPKNATVVAGKTATFKVVASGYYLSYQWQYKRAGASSWTNWSGKTEASLVVTAGSNNNGCRYRCVVKNSVGSVTSSAAQLTITNVKPAIQTNPSNASASLGKTATFKVVAAGSGLSYQWQYKRAGSSSWTNWSGKTEATLVVTAGSNNDGCQYRCVVKNSYGSVTSNAATLTVVTKPTITTQPSNASCALGKTVTYKVVATGKSLSYQWQYKRAGATSWTDWSGKTAATLSVTAGSNNNGCRFRCVVKNIAGSVTSNAAQLTITNAKPAIQTQPANASAALGKTATFKVVAAGSGLSYQWQYKRAGATSWTNWSGKTSATLTVTAGSNNNGCRFRCVVKNAYGTVTSSAATLTVK